MKKRLKYLLVSGIFTLSAFAPMQIICAEGSESELLVVSEDGEDKPAPEPAPTPEPTPAPEPAPPTPEPEPAPPTPEPEPTPTPPATSGSENAQTETAGTTEPAASEEQTSEYATSEIQTELSETAESITDTSAGSETVSDSETQKATTKVNKEKIDEKAAKEYEKTTGESVYVFGSYPAGNITENTNEIYDYLTKVLGLNHAGACGVLANIQCESNFNSTAVGDGGTSYGLCQWHLGRFSQLISWCNASGYNYHSIQGQLGYLTCELQGGYAAVYNYILNVPDTPQGAYDAAYYWCKYFEIPSNIEYNSQMRAELAEKEFYPQTLGTQEEKEVKETPAVTLTEDEMQRVLVDAPESISKLSSLSVSQEDTVQASVQSTKHSDAVKKKEMEKAAQEAIEQALRELDSMNKTENDSKNNVEMNLTNVSTDIAILNNTFTME